MQQFCLRWNNHPSNLLTIFEHLRQNEAFVDVTLAVEGLTLRAHRMVLSACSPYFQNILINNPDKHPIIFLKDVKYSDMKALLDFMYQGEVSVDQEDLSELLKVAEGLKIKGLTEVREKSFPELTKKFNILLDCNSSSPFSASHTSLLENGNNLIGTQKRKRGRPRTLSPSQNSVSSSPSLNTESKASFLDVSAVRDGENMESVEHEAAYEDIKVIVKHENDEGELQPESNSGSNCSIEMTAEEENFKKDWVAEEKCEWIDETNQTPYGIDSIPVHVSEIELTQAPSVINSWGGKQTETKKGESLQLVKKEHIFYGELKPVKEALTNLLAADNSMLTRINHKDNIIKCESSGSTVTRFSTLQDGTYACKLCYTTFTHPSNFHRHFITRHQRHRSFLCPVCKKSFNRRDNMTNHLRTVHKPSRTIISNMF